MEGLMRRTGVLAEGVVVMVCPVLLALALDKVDLKVYGRQNFIAMLTMAGVTLISGICPVLVCYFYQRFLVHDHEWPVPVTVSLATLSSSCLLILTCFIAQIIVAKKILVAVGAICGAFVLGQTVFYFRGHNAVPYPPEVHNKLNESHEFLTGVTGILFLGLEGLALERHDNQMLQKGGGAVATISFIVCALGVCFVYFEMTLRPDFAVEARIVHFTLVLDCLMGIGTFGLLIAVMHNLMGNRALLLFAPPVLIILELLYRVIANEDRVAAHGQVADPDNQEPASLELTKVTFTGFLAVSVTAFDNTSPRNLTLYFLLSAAAAIVSGISWRLLTQSHIRTCLAPRPTHNQVASSAKLASLCTHFFIVIATFLFLAMAGTASGK